MQKIGYLIIYCLIFSGCASLKPNTGRNEILPDTAGLSINERVARQNLSAKGFFIQKAEIEYTADGKKETFLATIKFVFPDRYLISFKSKTGIEGARIYINKDSVLVNDRINKITYFVNTLFLRRKFGIDQNFLPLVYGDLIDNSFKYSLKNQCVNGTSVIERNIHGVRLHYIIDCKKGKSESVEVASSTKDSSLKIEYQGFRKILNFLYPGEINLNYIKNNIRIRLMIKKIEFPWNGAIKFLPGKGYQITELL